MPHSYPVCGWPSSVWTKWVLHLHGWDPLAGPSETSPKTLLWLTAAPWEPGNWLNARSTKPASNEGEPRAPTQGTKPGPLAALGYRPLPWPVQDPRVIALIWRVEEQLRQQRSEQSSAFLPKACSLQKKKKVLFQSRFLFFRVCLLPLTLCPQPRCLPFPNAPPLSTFQKKGGGSYSSPLVFPSRAWKLEEIQIKLAAL